MKIHSSYVVILAALLGIATSASAEDTGYYGQLSAGYSKSEGAEFGDQKTTSFPQITGNLQSTGHFSVIDAGIGYRYSADFRSDLTYSRRGGYELNSNDSKVATTNYKSNITADTFMANGYWNFYTASASIKPYVGLGLGWSRNKMDSLNYVDSVQGFSGTAPGGSNTNFAWQLMLGADVPLSNVLTLDFGYHYVDLGNVSTSPGLNTGLYNNVAFNPFIGDGIKGKLHANEFQIGLRYKF